MWIVKSEVLVLLLSYICLDLKDDVKSKEQENEEVVWTRSETKREEIWNRETSNSDFGPKSHWSQGLY